MHTQTNNSDKNRRLWIQGRETSIHSPEKGDVVVFKTNIWSAPRPGIPVVGTLEHGTEANLLEIVIDDKLQEPYYLIHHEGIQGWVSGLHVAHTWSQFVITGILYPSEICKDLQFSTENAGIKLTISDHQFIATTEGDQDHVELILLAVERMLYKLIIAQTFLSGLPLSYQTVNWIEIPVFPLKKTNRLGFLPNHNVQSQLVKAEDLSASYDVIAKLPYSPYLELAINDYDQAIRHPQHALIFLARAIESIEKYFDHFVHMHKGKRKEELMREALGISKADVTYVTKRANMGHMRHASSTSRPEAISQDELQACYNHTKLIIQSFIKFYSLIGL